MAVLVLFGVALLAFILGMGAGVSFLSRRLSLLEVKLASLERAGAFEPELPVVRTSPLRGLRVQLALEQDHKIPAFANLLEKELAGADVVLSGDSPVDLIVSGRIVCNGYSDSYFLADLIALAGVESVYAVVARPPHGDRISNLAKEFVAGLEREWDSRTRRNERQKAVDELGPS